MNEYDSSRMADLLRETHGYQRVESEEEADLILLNTCSIREKAQEKVFHQLGRWKALKSLNPGLLIGVGGCVASQEGEAIRGRAPHVDMVFGPQTLHRLPEMLNALAGSQPGAGAGPGSEPVALHAPMRTTMKVPLVDVTFPEIEKFDRLPEPKADG